jgi:hypothetical protein
MPEQTPLEHATQQWREANLAIALASGGGNPPDPYRYAALLDARAGWFDHLGRLADQATGTGQRDVYAIACSYAAELDRNDAAAVRFRYRIPSLHPKTDATRIGLLRDCQECGRLWQLDRDAPPNRCEACPDLLHGITPHSTEQARTYPPGEQWVPGPDRTEDDDE